MQVRTPSAPQARVQAACRKLKRATAAADNGMHSAALAGVDASLRASAAVCTPLSDKPLQDTAPPFILFAEG